MLKESLRELFYAFCDAVDDIEDRLAEPGGRDELLAARGVMLDQLQEIKSADNTSSFVASLGLAADLAVLDAVLGEAA